MTGDDAREYHRCLGGVGSVEEFVRPLDDPGEVAAERRVGVRESLLEVDDDQCRRLPVPDEVAYPGIFVYPFCVGRWGHWIPGEDMSYRYIIVEPIRIRLDAPTGFRPSLLVGCPLE